jgi:hypothetical protein
LVLALANVFSGERGQRNTTPGHVGSEVACDAGWKVRKKIRNGLHVVMHLILGFMFDFLYGGRGVDEFLVFQRDLEVFVDFASECFHF